MNLFDRFARVIKVEILGYYYYYYYYSGEFGGLAENDGGKQEVRRGG